MLVNWEAWCIQYNRRFLLHKTLTFICDLFFIFLQSLLTLLIQDHQFLRSARSLTFQMKRDY